MADAQRVGVGLKPIRLCGCSLEFGFAAANGQEGEYIRSSGYNHHFILSLQMSSRSGFHVLTGSNCHGRCTIATVSLQVYKILESP